MKTTKTLAKDIVTLYRELKANGGLSSSVSSIRRKVNFYNNGEDNGVK